MTEQVLAWLGQYGIPVIGLVVGLGCFGVPMPSSLMILVGASLAVTGEFALPAVLLVCLGAAVAGDQLGYLLGRLLRTQASGTGRLALLARPARDYLARRGTLAVFLSRWLTSPLGPMVNLSAGAFGMHWRRFSLAGLAGEIVWVALYAALGIAFGQFVPVIDEIAGNLTALIAALVVMGLLGRYLLRSRRGTTRADANADAGADAR